MIEKLGEIASKLWSVGKLVVPLWGMFEFVKWVFAGLIAAVKGWVIGRIDEVWGLVMAQLEVLRVDLAPPAAFLAFVGKANSVIPLSEMWSFPWSWASSGCVT
jgi:hypothetical protein